MLPILVLSSAKRIATQMLVIEKLNGRKDFILRGFVYDIIRSSKELPVQRKLLKHKNKVWKLFRIKNEDNGVVPVSLLLTVNILNMFNADFEQANICRVLIENINTFKEKIGYNRLCCSILKFINKQHLNLYLHRWMNQ